MTAAASPTRARIPALDALRGIAVLAVLIFHLTRRQRDAPWFNLAGWGWMGVDLFFVLSGFLITGILLEAKARRTAGSDDYFSRFYGRRVRRIFPIAMLTLAGLCFVLPALSAAGAELTAALRRDQWAFWLYVNNWLVPLHGDAPKFGPAGHYWSLAVEEQFYLVWPLVVLACTRRGLIVACVSIVTIVPLLRTIVFATGGSPEFIYGNTFCRADSLAWGALAAVALAADRDRALRVARRALVPLAYAVIALVGVSAGAAFHPVMQTVGYSLLACGASAVVVLAAAEPSHRVSALLARATSLQRLGIVSYGVYVLHVPLKSFATMAGWTVLSWSAQLGSYTLAQWLYYFAVGGASVLLASASWRWIERPILEGRWPVRFRTSAPQLAE